MQQRYFAASNSSEGFKSYFSEVFERADRLYVIKGGPGGEEQCVAGMQQPAAPGEMRPGEVCLRSGDCTI